MEPIKTVFQFRSRTYEMLIDSGNIAVSEQSSNRTLFNLEAALPSAPINLEKAKRKVEKVLMQRPDPGMTFSD